jgi:hypothetical protein
MEVPAMPLAGAPGTTHATPPAPADDEPDLDIALPPIARPTRKVKVTPRRQIPARKPADVQRDEYARRVVEQGERPADLAVEAGRSKRAIELWVKDYRARHPIPTIARTDGVFTQTEPQANGYSFPGAAMEEVSHGA